MSPVPAPRPDRCETPWENDESGQQGNYRIRSYNDHGRLGNGDVLGQIGTKHHHAGHGHPNREKRLRQSGEEGAAITLEKSGVNR